MDASVARIQRDRSSRRRSAPRQTPFPPRQLGADHPNHRFSAVSAALVSMRVPGRQGSTALTSARPMPRPNGDRKGSITMRMRKPWWRLLSGGLAAAFSSALLAGAGAATAPASATPKPTAHVTPTGTWGTAKELPGLAALNKGGDATVYSVSCPSPGNCGAAGTYVDGASKLQAFVANQTNGSWGKAIEVPGIEALNVAGDADFITLSCASPGNCSAGGEYAVREGHFVQAFVVTETNGTWGKAIEVPGIQALSVADDAEVTALSCASPGNCSAAGHYGSGHGRAVFVAIQTPGTQRSKVGFAEVVSVSCPAPGDCTAGGGFTVGRFESGEPFVVRERNGTWGKAIVVPGIRALNVGGSGSVGGLSCAAVGECSAGGSYQDGRGFFQAFVVNERNGTWGKAIEVPGTAALNHQDAAVDSLSCASPGNCSASGIYTKRNLLDEPYVVTETNGTWGKAIEVPGIAALNTDEHAHVNSASCGAAGNCSVGGDYLNARLTQQAFVVNQAHGTWGKAIEVPGTAALNKDGQASVASPSCAAPGRCSAVGYYTDGRGRVQVFVATET